jgi:hypothetical protein
MNCPLCNATLPSGTTTCPACGTDLTLGAQETVSEVTPRAPRLPVSDSGSKRNPISQSSFSRVGYEGHYVAGTTLADRYRIVALLGKGAWARSIAPRICASRKPSP